MMWVGDGPIGNVQETSLRRLVLFDLGEGSAELGVGLEELGWCVTVVSSLDELSRSLDDEPTVVACRMEPGGADLAALARSRTELPLVPVVFYTCGGEVEDVLRRWREGAFDVLAEPGGCSASRMVDALDRAHRSHVGAVGELRRRVDEEQRHLRGVQRQRLELRHARRQQLGAMARLQVANEVLEEEARVHEELEGALTEEQDRVARISVATGALLRDLGAEVQSPLEDILGAVELLLDGDVDEQVCQQALRICAAARQLSGTVRDVMDLAALEDGSDPLEPEPVDLLAFLHDLAGHVQHRAEDVDIALHVHAGVGAVWVDAAKLRHVLLQLLLGVVELPSEHRLELEAWGDVHGVRVHISPVKMGPGTWRAAELIRWLGGSLIVRDNALEFGLRTADAEAQPPELAVFDGRLDTLEVASQVRRAVAPAIELPNTQLPWYSDREAGEVVDLQDKPVRTIGAIYP